MSADDAGDSRDPTETLFCINEAVYGSALKAGRAYRVIAVNSRASTIKVRDERGRVRWYPASCFDTLPPQTMEHFTIDDDIVDPDDDCVEVTVYLSGGERRWCYFATGRWVTKATLGIVEPKRVVKHGLKLNQVTMLAHSLRDASGISFSMISVPHLVITSTLSAGVIDATLRYLISQDDFYRSSNQLA